jgi:hypothetical protein
MRFFTVILLVAAVTLARAAPTRERFLYGAIEARNS